MAYAASLLYPEMAITVLDLPAVVECSSSFEPPIKECPMKHRVHFKSGDFFKDILPSADLYVLTRILQSFDEENILFILMKVFNSLPSGGFSFINIIEVNINCTTKNYGYLIL